MRKSKSLVLVILLLLGIGFASVSTTLYLNGNVNISANSEDFDVRFTKAVIDNEDRSNTTISNDGKTITYTTKELQALNDKSILDFEITNNSSIYDAEININCVLEGENKEYYNITKEVANVISAKQTESGSIEVSKIKVSDKDIEDNFICTLTAVAKERTTKGTAKVNPNIEKIYKYDGSNCITGEETNCIETTCPKDELCEPGTIIKYRVNDSEVKYFYVLHDDGDDMTLIQRENTITSIGWYENAEDNTKGPLTALPALEGATNGWTNVNTINYSMGTTIFNDNSYTGCDSYNSCMTNTYTLGNRSGKARMITVQEAAAVGCTNSILSCPVWMFNYLNGSTSYGGTTSGVDYGYWTMNSNSLNNTYTWNINTDGRLGDYVTIYKTNGIRAVVYISK